MDSKNKKLLRASLVILAVLVAGFVLFSPGIKTSMSGQSVLGSEENPGIKEFNVVANAFEFSPETMTVNEGDTVVLNIESVDVEHGFALPQFGVSQTLPVGETVTVQFVADKKGTYTFFCNVYCGAGHGSMKGTLVVE